MVWKPAVFTFSYKSKVEMVITSKTMKWSATYVGEDHEEVGDSYKLAEGDIPAFVRPLVLQLIAETQLPKRISLDWNYVVLGSEVFLVYDTIHANDEPLVTARIEKALFHEFNKAVLDEYTRVHKQRKVQVPAWVRKAGRISIKMTMNHYSHCNRKTEMVANLDVSCTRHPLGEFANVLMLPGFPLEGKLPEHAIVLGAAAKSANVWENLTDLSRALGGKGSKIVFLRGEPGSGKEVYATAFHSGSFRNKKSKFVLRSVAGMDAEDFRRELFGYVEGAHEISGKIAEAEGGTLFLDEFDKLSEAGSYGELLRVLEAGVYYPVGGKSERKTKLNWILAGAFSPGNSGSHSMGELPKDIWSRFTHEINLKNPLEDKKDGGQYIAKFYQYWILRDAIDSAPAETVDKKFELLLTSDDYMMGICRKFIFGDSKAIKATLSPVPVSVTLQRLSDRFSQYSGKYRVYLNNGRKPEKTLPQKAWVDDAGTYDYYDAKKTLTKWSKLRQIAAKYFDVKPKEVTFKDNFDGLRPIRQAARQAFQLAMEIGIKNGPDTFEPKISDLIGASLKTLRLAREGVELAERFLEYGKGVATDPKKWRKD